MFSPDAGLHDRAASLRNPRRRQRTSSSDSLAIAQQATKRRKRSALGDTSFESSEKTLLTNESADKNAPSRSEAARRSSGAMDSSLDTSALAHRSKGSKREKRGTRSNDGVELTKTDTYVLTRERNTPQALQDIISTEPWHAKLCPDLGFAVAFTQSRAIVWRYAHTSLSANHDYGVYVIKLADAAPTTGSGQDAFDTLPVGTLVHDAGAGDIALLAILPGGKIQYFESVRAASEQDALRPKPSLGDPLKSAISGVYSTERITRIAEAEADGFLLSTDSGRLFHLSVRDAQGRPQITTQFLKIHKAENSSILGSLRNALKFSKSSPEIIGINTIPGRERSHRNVLVATSKGVVQLWKMARHGPKTIENEWDIGSSVSDACRIVAPDLLEHESPSFLDLSLGAVPSAATELEIRAWVLASFPSGGWNKLFVVGLTLRADAVIPDPVHYVRSSSGPETTPGLVGRALKPTLLVPQPATFAFVAWDTKIAMVSLIKPESNPSMQLHSENHDLADNYEECVYFSRKHSFHIVGGASGAASSTADAVCDFLIYGFGQIRLSTTGIKPADNTIEDANSSEEDRRGKAIRMRLEQIVFFGNMSDNFLDFQNEAIWRDVSSSELEISAMRIRDSIMNSTSPFTPRLSPSTDLQLKNRLQAIQELNKFSRKFTISQGSRWEMLWSAEKLAAARAVYAAYDDRLSKRKAKQRLVLESVCEMMLDRPRGESDIVRHLFASSIDDFAGVVCWAQQALVVLEKDGVNQLDEQAPLVSQSNDIMLTALDAAMAFRREHTELFGLGEDMVLDGVYQGNYEQMESIPWTSGLEVLDNLSLEASWTSAMLAKLDQTDESFILSFDHEGQILWKFAQDAERLVDATFRGWEELCRWKEAHPKDEDLASPKQLRTAYASIRIDLLAKLTDPGLQGPALQIAEKYHDMHTLAELTGRLHLELQSSLSGNNPYEELSPDSGLEIIENKMDGYFDEYGAHWADAFFEQQITEGESARMLVRYPHRQEYLTQFLRKAKQSEQQVRKVSWINEVRAEKSFDNAADDLRKIQRDETQLWSKQIQLSLAKLAKLAACERKQIPDGSCASDVKKLNQRLQITAKQEMLYNFVKPILRAAIDESAELELAMDTLKHYVGGKPTLTAIFCQDLSKLVQREVLEIEEMIDLYSLMDAGAEGAGDPEVADGRFYNALWLLHTSGLGFPQADRYRAQLAERIIWRRCILSDDWAAIDQSEGKSDEAGMYEFRRTAVYKTLSRGYETGFFDNSANSHPPLEPSDLSGAGVTVADLRNSTRYEKSTDSFLAALAKDHASEDAALDKAIAEGRLEQRWKGLIDLVKDDLRGEQDERGRIMAFKEAQRQEIERLLEQEKAGDDTGDQTIGLPDVPQEAPGPHHETAPYQNGHNGDLDAANERGNDAALKKSKKKANTVATKKKVKPGKKKEQQEEKENKDAEGDVVMAS